MTTSDPPADDLRGREVIVAVGGGIAAYKVCDLVSKLAQRGAGVTVTMTKAAQEFVGPLTFQALSGRGVLADLWRGADPDDIQHIALTERADLLIVAPATANLIGKLACGIADDVVTTVTISFSGPLLLAPAMNERMWENPAVQQNIATLRARGAEVIGPGCGWLACRTVASGRLAEPAEILNRVVSILKTTPPRTTS